jgi:hypothetical protein
MGEQNTAESKQDEFDLGLPKPGAEVDKVIDGIRRATEARAERENAAGPAGRLERARADFARAAAGSDEEESARDRETSHKLGDPVTDEAVRRANALLAESDRQRKSAERVVIRDAESAAQRPINERGRAEVAEHWTPPERDLRLSDYDRQVANSRLDDEEEVRAVEAGLPQDYPRPEWPGVLGPDEIREAVERLQDEKTHKQLDTDQPPE